jgi:hypothetical protein
MRDLQHQAQSPYLAEHTNSTEIDHHAKPSRHASPDALESAFSLHDNPSSQFRPSDYGYTFTTPQDSHHGGIHSAFSEGSSASRGEQSNGFSNISESTWSSNLDWQDSDVLPVVKIRRTSIPDDHIRYHQLTCNF